MTAADARFAEVAAGGDFTCARAADAASTVTCWGDSSDGRLGDGITTPHTTTPLMASPVLLPGPAARLAAGNAHACAVLASGQVACWGANDAGQLGNGTTQSAATPTLVPGVDDGVAVAAGDQHTCVLRATGRVYCWGANVHGQLGTGTTSRVPQVLPVLAMGL
jgi:alpha-tubulin suppressor-like RCC1 family protein